MQNEGSISRYVITLATAWFAVCSASFAQEAEPQGTESGSDAATVTELMPPSPAADDRRVHRLGDAEVANEWELDMSVPQPPPRATSV